MEDKDGTLGFRPPHPGEYLRVDIIPALEMSVTEFANHLGVTRTTMSKLINEKSSVSHDMAIRLGQALKNGARYWLALQMQHDMWERERNTDIEVKPIDWNGAHAA